MRCITSGSVSERKRVVHRKRKNRTPESVHECDSLCIARARLEGVLLSTDSCITRREGGVLCFSLEGMRELIAELKEA